MTREEAAEILKRSVEELNDAMAGVTMNEFAEATIRRHIDAYSMAVDALLEKVGVSDTDVGKHEPRHGQWVGEGDGYADGEIVIDVWYCSECGHCIDDGTDDPYILPNYCPNCGAKMDSEDSHDSD